MSVTVVVRREARPGEAPALVAAMVDWIEGLAGETEPRRSARLYQGLTDPDGVLYMADWDTRHAQMTNLAAAERYARFDAFCAEPPRRALFKQIAEQEQMGADVAVVACMLIDAAADQSAALHAFLTREARQAVAAHPGFVLRNVYEGLEAPHRFFVVSGWDSVEACERSRATLTAHLEPTLRAMGATIERFIGHARAVVDHYAPPGWRGLAEPRAAT
jgi:quinol monooxygenase YgiN